MWTDAHFKSKDNTKHRAIKKSPGAQIQQEYLCRRSFSQENVVSKRKILLFLDQIKGNMFGQAAHAEVRPEEQVRAISSFVFNIDLKVLWRRGQQLKCAALQVHSHCTRALHGQLMDCHQCSIECAEPHRGQQGSAGSVAPLFGSSGGI